MPEGFAPSGPDDAERAAARERLTRLEEAAAFSDRAIENLTEQMLDLDGKLRRAMARLAAIEARLEHMERPALASGGAVRTAEDAAAAEGGSQSHHGEADGRTAEA